MDGISLAASVSELWDVACKLKSLAGKIKNARKEWETYWKSLQALTHIVGTINMTIRVLPSWEDIKISNNGEQEGLVYYCTSKVRAILNETKDTLRKFKNMELKRTRGAKGLRDLIANLLRRWKFSVDGDAIRQRLEDIEMTKSSLQLALLLVLVEQKCSTQRHTQHIQRTLRNIKSMLAAKEKEDQNELEKRPDVPLNLRFVEESSNSSKSKEQFSESSGRQSRRQPADSGSKVKKRRRSTLPGSQTVYGSSSKRNWTTHSSGHAASESAENVMSGGLRRDSRSDVVYRHKEPHHNSGSRNIRSQQIAHENRTSKETPHNRQSKQSLVSHESKAESQARNKRRKKDFPDPQEEALIDLNVSSKGELIADNGLAGADAECDPVELGSHFIVTTTNAVSCQRCSSTDGQLCKDFCLFRFCVVIVNHGATEQLLVARAVCNLNRCQHITLEVMAHRGEEQAELPFQFYALLGPDIRNRTAFDSLKGSDVEIPVQTLQRVESGRPYPHTFLVVHTLDPFTTSDSGGSLQKTEIHAILDRETVEVGQDEDEIESEADDEGTEQNEEGHQEESADATDIGHQNFSRIQQRDKYGLLRAWGFSALPCFHCKKDAVNPKSDVGYGTSLLIYGSVGIGYICEECKDRTWFSAGKWIWE